MIVCHPVTKKQLHIC